MQHHTHASTSLTHSSFIQVAPKVLHNYKQCCLNTILTIFQIVFLFFQIIDPGGIADHTVTVFSFLRIHLILSSIAVATISIKRVREAPFFPRPSPAPLFVDDGHILISVRWSPCLISFF